MTITPSVHIHRLLHEQQARQREQAQGVPRPARIRFAVQTVGVGESRLSGLAAINFGAYLLEEPTFTWGVMALDHLHPGADMGFKVESVKFNVRLKFTLTFEGTTLRTTARIGSGTLRAVPVTNTYQGVETSDPL